MALEYTLGRDDNLVIVYDVIFDLKNPTHYLDVGRIAIAKESIALGRIVLTSSVPLPDDLLGLPPIRPNAGGGGTSFGDSGNVTYTLAGDTTIHTVEDALNKLFYKPPIINSFTVSPNVFEKGDVLQDATFTWDLSNGITKQLLSGTELALSIKQITLPVSLTDSETFYLDVNDGIQGVVQQVSINSYYKVFYGTALQPTLTDFTQLTGELSDSRSLSKIINGGGKYIYVAYPQSWGEASFTINNLLNTAWTTSTTLYTRGSLETVYRVYRSSYRQTGSEIDLSMS